MKVIKSTNPDRLARAVVLDLGDLSRQAEAILADARAGATQILAEARREAAALTGAAREQGQGEGRAAGLAEGRAEGERQGREETLRTMTEQLQAIVASWAAALEQWERDRGDMLLHAREDVLVFAVETARRLVFRVAESDPGVVTDQLAEALSLLCRPTAVEVLIDPADRPLMEAALPDLLAGCGRCEHVTLRDDESVGRGGCVVRTAGGSIDATLQTQMDRIVAALLPAPRSLFAHPEDEPGDAT